MIRDEQSTSLAYEMGRAKAEEPSRFEMFGFSLLKLPP